jgi:hypothetical protein
MGVAGRGLVAEPLWRAALDAGHLARVERLAGEKGYVTLRDALRILELMRFDERYERAAVRWLARLALEGQDVDLEALRVAAAAMGVLPDSPESAMKRLVAVCQRYGVA